MSVKSETRFPIRVINTLAPVFRSTASTKFDPDELMEKAAKSYGRDDFGDPRFSEGLQVLCDAVNKEGKLHAFGQIFSRFLVLNLLRNRIELAQRWQDHPEVLKVPVERPVFIVGQPRTGTTLLFNLLALDDRFRYFRSWEAGRPGLPRDDRKQIQKAKKESLKTMGTFNYMRPELKKIHHLAVEKPEECIFLLANSFEAGFFPFMFTIRSYYDWFKEQDHGYPYAYYKRQLQWMQSKTPGKRWLLKTPAHLAAFEELFNQFPDAVILQTHRDPQKSIPSLCSLKYNFQSMSSYEIDKKEISRFMIDDLSDSLRTAFELRETKQLNVYDIQYSDLIKSPITILEQVYKHIGEDFSDTMKIDAGNYLASNPKNKFGKHRYNGDEFGLDKKELIDKFEFYYSRFNRFL